MSDGLNTFLETCAAILAIVGLVLSVVCVETFSYTGWTEQVAGMLISFIIITTLSASLCIISNIIKQLSR